ncbi:unnamed protein product [Scytosiphon promiscuus]
MRVWLSRVYRGCPQVRGAWHYCCGEPSRRQRGRGTYERKYGRGTGKGSGRARGDLTGGVFACVSPRVRECVLDHARTFWDTAPTLCSRRGKGARTPTPRHGVAQGRRGWRTGQRSRRPRPPPPGVEIPAGTNASGMMTGPFDSW